MKYKLILGMIVLSTIFSSLLAFADGDDAPPALPSEYWGSITIDGNPAANNLPIVAEVNGIDYTQESPVTFNNGYYNLMLVEGDRPLTYNDDPNCNAHNLTGEACIRCTKCEGANCVLGYNENTCIEGPQDGEIVTIKVDDDEVMPTCLSWNKGNSVEIEAIYPIGDWSKNGCVNLATDFPYFGAHYDFTCSDLEWELIYDLNCDCVINLAGDFPIFGIHYEEGCGG